MVLPGTSFLHMKRAGGGATTDKHPSPATDIPAQKTMWEKAWSGLSGLFKSQKPANQVQKLGSTIVQGASSTPQDISPLTEPRRPNIFFRSDMPERLKVLIGQHSGSAWTAVQVHLANHPTEMSWDHYFQGTGNSGSGSERLLRALNNLSEFSDDGIEHLGWLMQKYTSRVITYEVGESPSLARGVKPVL